MQNPYDQVWSHRRTDPHTHDDVCDKDMMMTMVMMMMIEKKKGKDFPGLDRGRGRGAMSLQCADPAWSLPLAPTY